jgi:predicted component of type VI protein secretion system
MKDGRTRRVATRPESEDGFLATHEVSLMVASGPLAGSEMMIEQTRVVLGRGSSADVVLDDASVSSEHAVLELFDGGYRLRDLGSTNGVRVNGASVSVADLKHGDRIELGSLLLRYVVAGRENVPPTHVLFEK